MPIFEVSIAHDVTCCDTIKIEAENIQGVVDKLKNQEMYEDCEPDWGEPFNHRILEISLPDNVSATALDINISVESVHIYDVTNVLWKLASDKTLSADELREKLTRQADMWWESMGQPNPAEILAAEAQLKEDLECSNQTHA